MGRFFKYDFEIVAGDDHSISLTMKTAAGAPVNVSAWDVYYKAEARDTNNTDTISVAPAAVTVSDSGTGTVDTFTIPLSDTDTTVAKGFYDQEIAIKRSALVETIAKGTLNVVERLTTVA
jgi:hypothetical protein